MLWAMIDKKLDLWKDTPHCQFIVHLNEESLAIGNLVEIMESWEVSASEGLENSWDLSDAAFRSSNSASRFFY
jgi:hypothetical protein